MPLSNEEETILHLASLRGTESEMTFDRTELKTAVESIIAAREHEAARRALLDAADAAKPISGYMGMHRWISAEALRDRAASVVAAIRLELKTRLGDDRAGGDE